MTESKKNKELAQFIQLRSGYRNTLNHLIIQISQLLNRRKILASSIVGRVKELESIRTKLDTTNSFSKIRDLIGLRVIVQEKSDVIKVKKAIEDRYNVVNETEKEKEIYTLGYKAINLTIDLTKEITWLKIPPHIEPIKKFLVEIQIHTILQSFWTEMSHKLSYKKSKLTPKEERRLQLLSGVLEIIDEDFEALIAKKTNSESNIDRVSVNNNKTINFHQLVLWVEDRFGISGFSENKEDKPDELMQELEYMGIKSLESLDKIVSKIGLLDLNNNSLPHTLIDLIRYTMIIYNPDKYFSKAAIHKGSINLNSEQLFKDNNVNINEYLKNSLLKPVVG